MTATTSAPTPEAPSGPGLSAPVRTTTTTGAGTVAHREPPVEELPPWRRVLAVVAHPDDEALGLGGVLDAFARRGADVTVLCLTPGETFGGPAVSGDLLPLRRSQLAAAGKVLGVSRVELRDYANGQLESVAGQVLAADVAGEIDTWTPDGLLVFDPGGVNGRRDHVAATSAALEAATRAGVSVLGWGLPPAVADQLNEEAGTDAFTPIGAGSFRVQVDRERQRIATLTYANDASAQTVVWRRLELLGDTERLRWLRRAPADQHQLLVTHDAGDRFAFSVRGHRVVVDQPEGIGGDDLGPTPTELFVASLASCVAFYARRYLARHRLDSTGLRVEVAYDMASRPARVGEVTLRVVVPAGVPEERRAGLMAQVSHCTVHNSLHQPPEVTIDLELP